MYNKTHKFDTDIFKLSQSALKRMLFISAITLNYNNFEPKPNCYFKVFSHPGTRIFFGDFLIFFNSPQNSKILIN
jgi:hypothetical protein